MSRPWCSGGRPSRPGTVPRQLWQAQCCERCCGTSWKQMHSNFQGKESDPRGTRLARALRALAPEYRRNSSGPRRRTRRSNTLASRMRSRKAFAGHESRRTWERVHITLRPHCGSDKVRQAIPLVAIHGHKLKPTLSQLPCRLREASAGRHRRGSAESPSYVATTFAGVTG